MNIFDKSTVFLFLFVACVRFRSVIKELLSCTTGSSNDAVDEFPATAARRRRWPRSITTKMGKSIHRKWRNIFHRVSFFFRLSNIKTVLIASERRGNRKKTSDFKSCFFVLLVTIPAHHTGWTHVYRSFKRNRSKTVWTMSCRTAGKRYPIHNMAPTL